MSDLLAPRPPSASRVEMTQIVLPSDANALGTAFGGRIMQWVDIAAAVAARRHCGTTAVTASIDSLQFVHPVKLGDVVVLRATVNRAWRTSMEVGVRIDCEGEGLDAKRVHAATAYLTFVGVDDAGKPRPAPPVAPESDDERRRFDAAERRRARRLAERVDLREQA